MKTTALLSATLSAALLLAAAPALAQPRPPQQPQQLPAPKILVINRTAILQASKVGQDIARQVQGYANAAKGDMDRQARALQSEGQALQQQIAILAPDAKQKKIEAFQAKERNLQGLAQRKEQDIQRGLMQAQQTVEGVLGPILQNLLQQRGANMILDKNAVVFANSSTFDITQAAIDQLNQKMTTLKVSLGGPAPAPKK